LDGLTPVIQGVGRFLATSSPTPSLTPVYIIDAEGDSVGHYRTWHADGQLFLVRVDGQRRVLHDGRERTLDEVARRMARDGGLEKPKTGGTVRFKGKPAERFVGETMVVLHRPARRHRVEGGKRVHHNIAGPLLPLRLIVSQIRDAHGKVLARWLLLSNCPADVPAPTLADWYYWRWEIESFHKLLKQAGQHVEQWQQETALAFTRRLVVAAMAAVVVWRLARDDAAPARDLRRLLVRLSGRQMKRTRDARDFTEPALMAGLGILIPMLYLLREYDPQELRRLTEAAMPDIFQISPDTS